MLRLTVRDLPAGTFVWGISLERFKASARMADSEVVSSWFFCGEGLSNIGFSDSSGPFFVQFPLASQDVVVLFTHISTVWTPLSESLAATNRFSAAVLFVSFRLCPASPALTAASRPPFWLAPRVRVGGVLSFLAIVIPTALLGGQAGQSKTRQSKGSRVIFSICSPEELNCDCSNEPCVGWWLRIIKLNRKSPASPPTAPLSFPFA